MKLLFPAVGAGAGYLAAPSVVDMISRARLANADPAVFQQINRADHAQWDGKARALGVVFGTLIGWYLS